MTPVVIVYGPDTTPDSRHPCETWLEAWVYARALRREGRAAVVRYQGTAVWRRAVSGARRLW